MTIKSSFEEILETKGQLKYINKGVSMMPLIRHDRDIMVIENHKDKILKKYDIVLFKRNNGRYVLHRILKIKNNKYWIVGDNCYRGEIVEYSQILGILTSVYRDNKKVEVTSPLFKLYTFLWCDLYPLRFVILYIKSIIYRLLSKIYHFICK